MRKSRAKPVAFSLLAVAVLGGGGLAYRYQLAAQSATTEAPPPPPAPTTAEPVLSAEPPPPPTHTAEPPPPSASAPPPKPASALVAPAASIDPDQRAYLDATQLPAGRKIMVDGRVVGTAPRRVTVHCGMRRIQIEDQPPETINFPCGGGEVTFTE